MELTEEAEADVFCHLLADPDPVFGFARIISGSFFGHFSGFFPWAPSQGHAAQQQGTAPSLYPSLGALDLFTGHGGQGNTVAIYEIDLMNWLS